jgi:hypothetical protein
VTEAGDAPGIPFVGLGSAQLGLAEGMDWGGVDHTDREAVIG